jgi:DNA-directed RNA polymerase subunit RPC12/RpoP
MKIAAYSVENLYHFRCGECDKWWTIGDFSLISKLVIYCPHCGSALKIKENTVDK